MSRYYIDGERLVVVDGENGTIQLLSPLLNVDRDLTSIVLSPENIENAVKQIRGFDPSPEVLKKGFIGELDDVVPMNKKKIRCCKKCGQPGHRSDGCESKTETTDQRETRAEPVSEEEIEGIDPIDEQGLVWDIRSRWCVQKMNPQKVCEDLGITIKQMRQICEKYGIERE